jgi:calcineurin-like phosphoesterase family protein
VRVVAALLVLFSACSLDKARTATPATTTTTALVPGITVVAAGDIACPRSLTCTDTSTLIDALHPAAVLALGDLQYESGGLDDFRAVYDTTWGRFKSITHPAPGNHEYSTPRAAGYFAYFGGVPSWYSFDLGGWHLISLNSNCRSVGGCQPGSAEERWLKADLAAHPAKCTLAFWHHPRWSSGLHGTDPGYDAFWDDLANAGAELVLSGHDHDYERFAPDRGVRQIVAGTGGRSLYPVLHKEVGSEVVNDDTYGVLALTLHPSSYQWRFVPARAGGFTDSGQTDCR